MKKQLFYITNARMPTEKAHGFQIAQTCEAFGRAGVDTTLIVPTRRNPIKADAYDHYDLERSFSIRYLSSPDLLWLPLPRINFYLTNLIFLLRLLFLSIPKDAVIYTRSPEVAWYYARFAGSRTIVFEAHTWPQSLGRLHRWMLQDVDLIVTNSEGTAATYREQGFEEVLTARNGVDLTLFAELPTREEARDEFDLPTEQTIALYVGRFEEWKGIEVIFEAAHLAREDEELLFVISGGTPEEEASFRKRIAEERIPNIVVVPTQYGYAVPRLLATADVLLLPNVPVSEESRAHTSPIKTFSYMASGKPIIASDLPSIREVLDGETASLVAPGDAGALCAAIYEVRSDTPHAALRAARAREEVSSYTWDARVARIVEKLAERDAFREEGSFTACVFGDYDPSYARARVLLLGLERAGVTLVSCSAPGSSLSDIFALVRHLRTIRSYDIILVPHTDSRWMVPLARLFGRAPVVWDALYSRYDTIINDRKLAPRYGVKAAYHWLLEWLNVRLAHLILTDTSAHAAYFVDEFNAAPGRCEPVLVGTDNRVFDPTSISREGGERRDVVTIGFYGRYSPLHGVEHIVRAAALLSDASVHFRLLGSGQTYAAIRREAESLHLQNISFERKIPYEELPHFLAECDIVLGVFGDVEKAGRVVPNKVYEAVAMARPIITARTPGVCELFTDGEDILLVNQANPEDLAEKIRLLAADGALRNRLGRAAHERFLSVATPEKIGQHLSRVLREVVEPSL